MIPSPETMARIALLRQKARDSSLTLEEMKEAVAFLRQERMSMPQSKPSTKKAEVNVDDLLGELGI